MINKVIIAILLAFLIWMGISYKLKDNEVTKLKKDLSSAQLAANEKIKFVYKDREKKIYVIQRVGSSETTTNIIDINDGDNIISVDNDDTVTIQPQPWVTFPFSLNIAGHFAKEQKAVVGIRLVQFGKYGVGANVGVNDISVSLDRDIFDYFPMFQNSFVGAFYNFADENNRGGLRFGVKL